KILRRVWPVDAEGLRHQVHGRRSKHPGEQVDLTSSWHLVDSVTDDLHTFGSDGSELLRVQRSEHPPPQSKLVGRVLGLDAVRAFGLGPAHARGVTREKLRVPQHHLAVVVAADDPASGLRAPCARLALTEPRVGRERVVTGCCAQWIKQSS